MRDKLFFFPCILLFTACSSSALAQTAEAELTIRGDVAQSLVIKPADLTSMPRETVSVTEQDGTKVEYEGVPLREILKRAGAPVGKELRGKMLASYFAD